MNVKEILRDTIGIRIGTAVIGIGLILVIMVYGGWPGMAFLALACSCAAIFEYFVMVFTDKSKNVQKILGLGTGFVLSSAIIFRSIYLYEILGLVFLFLFMGYLVLAHVRGGNLSSLFTDLTLSLSGIFYIAFLFSFWPKICQLETGVYWIFLVFIIPWISDSAAYFIGRKMGHYKLSPVISPHKTVEGALAGCIFAVIGICIYNFAIFRVLTMMDCILLGVGGSAFSQCGDLFESFIKRALGVKDSGVVIPGHGGILDRFDSVMFCGPFIYFYAAWWGAL